METNTRFVASSNTISLIPATSDPDIVPSRSPEDESNCRIPCPVVDTNTIDVSIWTMSVISDVIPSDAKSRAPSHRFDSSSNLSISLSLANQLCFPEGVSITDTTFGLRIDGPLAITSGSTGTISTILESDPDPSEVTIPCCDVGQSKADIN